MLLGTAPNAGSAGGRLLLNLLGSGSRYSFFARHFQTGDLLGGAVPCVCGWIEVESKAGHGATFRIVLPRYRAAA